jgi:hypothetical protein
MRRGAGVEMPRAVTAVPDRVGGADRAAPASGRRSWPTRIAPRAPARLPRIGALRPPGPW